MNECGAKTRSGQPCKKAGMANGRCRLHGGLSTGAPIKTGRYSKYAPDKLGEKIAEFSLGDVLALGDELATQRALLSDYLERFKVSTMTRDDIGTVMGWLDGIGRTAERINKMRNEDTLTAAEVIALQARAVDIAMKYFHDPETRRQFLADLFGIGFAESRTERTLAAGGTSADG
jgi:hypothetical protein